MIVTVCMNPAIDKTVEIEKLIAGGLNRIKKVEYDAGGKGIETVAVSMGKSGAMFFWNGQEVECPALSVQAHSTVGAGDAMVAALSYAWEEKLNKEETVRLCMAASAGAVTTIGTKPPSRELVEELKKQVVMITA